MTGEGRSWEKFRRDTIRFADFADRELDALDGRLMAVEEVLAARWPRSWLLRRRLGRRLRASVAPYAWAGPSWRTRRVEAVADELDT